MEMKAMPTKEIFLSTFFKKLLQIYNVQLLN